MQSRRADLVVSIARTCHSLVRPVPHPKAVPETIQSIGAFLDEPGFGRVWQVPTDDGRAGSRAARLRETERRRPLPPGIRLRCVLLRHLDAAELILVAHRVHVPYCCLFALADAVSDGTGDGLVGWKTHVKAGDHSAGPGDTGAPRPVGPLFESPLSLSAARTGVDDVVDAVGVLSSWVLRRDQIDVVVEEPDAAPYVVEVSRDGTLRAGVTEPVDRQVGVLVTRASPDEYLPALAPPYPISVLVSPAGDRSVRVRTWVDLDEVEPGAGEVIAAHLPRRLAAGATAGTDPFLMSTAEIAEILRAGVGPGVTAGGQGGIHDAFVSVARTHAQRTALTGNDIELTYAELDERSRTVAGALAGRGIVAGDRVGVNMERTPHAVIAILAVLRAGACYVPLDPAHPAARRAYVAGDAGLLLIITDGDVAAGRAGTTAVTLDELLTWRGPIALPVVNGDDPAYVIYTSGTTGQPKGAVIPHRNVLALITATRPIFDLDDSDVWTLFHSLAFDFSVWEIWGCLLTGGRLLVVPYWTARAPTDFVQLLRTQRVTVLSQTPSAFANFIPAAISDGSRLDLRLIVFGGEALRTPVLADWLRHYPAAACRLVNMYGITETTVHVTWQDVTSVDVTSSSRSVGRALPGWSLSVRSAAGHVRPLDVAGEICVGGAGLAQGYHGQPELTEERFPVDPVSGERYYRSGDLGRLRPDGTLEHLGRVDDQVKVRGHRIELGEVRSAILDDPNVHDAVVAFHQDDQGGTINAYVIARVTVADLRGRLRARLPEYMIPAGLHLVARFPLTANGKVDLAALAASTGSDDAEPAGSMPGAAAGADGQLDLVATVHRAWADLFGPGQSGNDFFDLGGNSLHALTLSLVLDEIGEVRVGPQDVYLNPTVADLVALLQGGA